MPRRGFRGRGEGFYERCWMRESRRRELVEMRDEALESELRRLRAKLRGLMALRPNDTRLQVWAGQALAQATASEKRLRGKDEHLKDHLTALLNDLGDRILPGDGK